MICKQSVRRWSAYLCLVTLASHGTIVPVFAAEVNWAAAGAADWSTASNWSSATLPGANDWISFRTTAPAPATDMTMDGGSLSGGLLQVQTLTFDLASAATLGSAGSVAATLRLNGPAVNDPFTDLIAVTGSGNLTIRPLTGGTAALGIELNSSGSFRVANNSVTLGIDSVISQRGGARSLTKLGLGTLSLTAANTFTGALSTSAGTTAIGGSVGAVASTMLTVNGSSTLRLDNSTAVNLNRVLDTATVALNGGTFEYVGNSSGSSETAGSLRVTSGASNVNTTGAGANTLTFTGLTMLAGATITFNGIDADSKIMLSGQAAGALPAGAYVNSSGVSEFAVYDTTAGIIAMTGGSTAANYADASTTLIANRVNRPTGSFTATTTTINGLRLGNFNINGTAALTLNPTSGTRTGILKTGATASTISSLFVLGTTTTEIVINVDDAATGTLTLSGAITGSGKGLTKTGAGTLILSGVNGYTGPTIINQGALKLGVASAINVASPLTIFSGATLDLGTFALSNTNAGLNFLGGGMLAGSGAGQLTLASNASYQTLLGGESEATVSAKIALASWVVSSTTFTPMFTVGDGQSDVDLTISGIISGSGTVPFTKFGPGVLKLTNINTYTGATQAQMGTLLLDYRATNGSILPTTGQLQLGSGSLTSIGSNGRVTLIGNDNSVVSGPTVQNVNGLQLAIGSSNTIDMRPQSQSLTLNLGAITRLAGSTLNFAIGTSILTTVTTTTANTNNILGPYAVVNGLDWASASGSSPFTIAKFTAYVNDTYSANANVNVTTSATIPAGTAVGTLRFDAATPITLTLAGQFAAPGILVTPNVGANTITITGTGSSLIGTTAALGELIIHQYNTAAPLILSTNVTDQTAVTNLTQLVKTGPGTLILTGVTSMLTGGLRIEEGTLKFGLTDAIRDYTSNASARYIYLSAGATLDVSDVIIRNTALLSTGGPGRVLLGNTGSYTIGDNGSGTTLNHTIIGGANSVFSKQSVATLTVTGDNSAFEGTFRIRNGGVSFSSDASMGSPSATLSLENGVSNEWVSPYAAKLFITASFATSPTKKIILNGLTNNRHVIDVAAGTTFTVNNIVSGAAGLFKTNTGTMIFNAANTYVGSTQIDGGALTLGGISGSLVTSPIVVVNNLSTLTFDSTNSAFGGAGSRLQASNAQVVVNGGSFNILGNSSDTVELLNVLKLAGGPATITVQPGGGTATLRLTDATSGLVRDPTTSNATALFRGLGLGSSGTGAARILVDNGAISRLVGGNGADGSTSISILPYAIGDVTTAGLGDSFVTYGQYGIRPLDTSTEYATYTAAAATDNVRLVSGTALTGKTVNSIIFAPSATLSLTGSGTLNVTAGAMLFNGTVATTISGFSAINFGGTQGMLWVNNTATAGVAISGGLAGSAGLIKAGAGKLTITGASTYTGLTSINGGTLVVNNANSLGVNPSLAIESGGTFDLSAGSLSTFTIDKLTSTDYSGGTLVFGSSTAKTLVVGINGGGGTFSGAITGTVGTFIKEGSGELILNGLNTFTGQTVINGGTLQVIREASYTGTAAIWSSAVTINPGGTFHSSYQQNANNSGPYPNTGSLTLHNGTFAVSNLNTVTTGGGLNSNGPSIPSITLGSGMDTFLSVTTPTIDTTTVSVTTLNRNQRSTLLILSASSLGSRAVYRLLSINTATNNADFVGGLGTTTNRSIVPYLVVDSNLNRTGATFATLTPSTATTTSLVTPLPLTGGYATYAAATTVDNVRITTGGSITGKTINALVIDNTAASAYTLTGTGSLDITSGAILFSGTKAVTVNNFSGLTTGATSSIVSEYIFHVANTDVVNWNVPLTSTANAFTKSSAGTLIFGAANQYSGTTTLNAGTLSVAQSNYLGDGSATNTLVFSGGTLAATGSFSTSRNMTFNSGGGGVNVAAGQSLTLSGTTAGSGGLTKSGSGSLTLSANVAYSGKTTVREGTLIVDGGIASTSGAVTVGGGVLPASLDFGPSVTIAAPITIAALGTLTGTGSITADLTIASGGTVSPGDTAIGTLTSAAGKTVTFAGTGVFNFQVDNVVGAPGTNWDYLLSVGILNLAATGADPFRIKLTGDASGFLPSSAYDGTSGWNFVHFDSVNGTFDPAAFVVEPTGNFGLAPGSFYVSQSGNDLYVNYQVAAVPEPGSMLLVSIAGFLAWLQRRWRKKQAEAAIAATAQSASEQTLAPMANAAS